MDARDKLWMGGRVGRNTMTPIPNPPASRPISTGLINSSPNWRAPKPTISLIGLKCAVGRVFQSRSSSAAEIGERAAGDAAGTENKTFAGFELAAAQVFSHKRLVARALLY